MFEKNSKEIEFEMLLCNHIIFLGICKWASHTFSGSEIAAQTVACDGNSCPGVRLPMGP